MNKDNNSIVDIATSSDENLEVEIDETNTDNTSNNPKLTKESTYKLQLETRDIGMLKELRNFIEEVTFDFDKDEEESLAKTTIIKTDKKINDFFVKSTKLLVDDMISNAIIENGNPLIEQELNKEKKEMLENISNMGGLELSEKYNFIKPFLWTNFQDEVLPLEEEFLLSEYNNVCSKYLKTPENVKTLKKFSDEMLSEELEVYLEEIARF